jgi:hypothetical protein
MPMGSAPGPTTKVASGWSDPPLQTDGRDRRCASSRGWSAHWYDRDRGLTAIVGTQTAGKPSDAGHSPPTGDEPC